MRVYYFVKCLFVYDEGAYNTQENTNQNPPHISHSKDTFKNENKILVENKIIASVSNHHLVDNIQR